MKIFVSFLILTTVLSSISVEILANVVQTQIGRLPCMENRTMDSLGSSDALGTQYSQEIVQFNEGAGREPYGIPITFIPLPLSYTL
jgi:hypothetical protein